MDYVSEFKETYGRLVSEVDVLRDLNPTVALEVTQAIIQEKAKDNRQSKIQRDYNNDKKEKDRSNRDWLSESATDSQKELLTKLSVDYDEDLTKGEASDLIEEHIGGE